MKEEHLKKILSAQGLCLDRFEQSEVVSTKILEKVWGGVAVPVDGYGHEKTSHTKFHGNIGFSKTSSE